MSKAAWLAASLMLPLLTSTANAKDAIPSSPQAAARSHAQNYKDMVLASCVAQAYQKDTKAAADAGSSVSALRDWTLYDLEQSPDAVQSLVDNYLARDYHNPLVEPDIKGIRFDFLKCLDLYHSRELARLVKQLVIHPQRSYRQDNSRSGTRQ